MRRRDLLCHLAALPVLSLPVVQGCSSNRPLNTGVHPWIGYESLYLAHAFDWLGSGVNLVFGNSATDTVEGLANGTLEAGALTLDEVLRTRARGVPLTICAVMDVSAGADALMVRESVATLSDLRGLRIGVEQSALGALLLSKALDAAQMTLADVQLVDVTVDQQPDAWQRGEIDAAVTYEPVLTRLRAQGGRRLFDSRQTPDTIFDVLAVVDRDLPDVAARDLVHGHFAGRYHLLHNNHDAIYRVASHQGLQPTEVRRALAGIMLPDLVANYRYLRPDSALMSVAQRLNTLMVELGLLPQPDSLEDLFSDQWLPSKVRV